MASPIGSFKHISTATTTNITPCSVLKRIVINTAVVNSSITINDGVGGTNIATITFGAALPGDVPSTLHYDCSLATGTLSIVTVSTNDITVVYE